MKSIYSEREEIYSEERWICPLCGKSYQTKEEAMKCWNVHYKAEDIEVEEFDFDPNQCFPSYMYIVSKDGGEATYKRIM